MPKEKLKPCLLEDDIALLFPEHTQEMLDKILDCPHRRADQPDKAEITLHVCDCCTKVKCTGNKDDCVYDGHLLFTGHRLSEGKQ